MKFLVMTRSSFVWTSSTPHILAPMCRVLHQSLQQLHQGPPFHQGHFTLIFQIMPTICIPFRLLIFSLRLILGILLPWVQNILLVPSLTPHQIQTVPSVFTISIPPQIHHQSPQSALEHPFRPCLHLHPRWTRLIDIVCPSRQFLQTSAPLFPQFL